MKGSAQESKCTACHAEHAGTDYTPLPRSFPYKSFSHSDTGFALEGAHGGLECRQCHRAANIPPAGRARIKIKDLGRTYFGLRPECATCHQDPHRGGLGGDCRQCHGMDAWTPAISFDHSQTRFPLTGLHAAVECAQCHQQAAPASAPAPAPAKSVSAKTAPVTHNFGGLNFADCDGCHRDPHNGSFKFSCWQCHQTSGWSNLKSANPFDHSGTGFALKGAHQSVACGKCHPSSNFQTPVAHAQCADCHQDPHRGQFANRGNGECSVCHTEDAFHPTIFDVSMHQQSAFPLNGKHAEIPCAQCHPGEKAEANFHPPHAQCVDCHADAHRGQVAAEPWRNECSRCHTENGFTPSLLSLVDHQRWRFPLEGAHRAVACTDCHSKSSGERGQQAAPAVTARIVPPSKSALETVSDWEFHPASARCGSCHQDPHHFAEGTMAHSTETPDCANCHVVSGWNETRPFDHSRTGFALQGAHRGVSCLQCHKAEGRLTGSLQLAFHAAPTQCAKCHEDPHGGQFAAKEGGDCEACHSPDKWRPSNFDHERQSTFSLAGAHVEVPCRQCHTLTETREGKPVLLYAGVARRCAECHQ